MLRRPFVQINSACSERLLWVLIFFGKNMRNHFVAFLNSLEDHSNGVFKVVFIILISSPETASTYNL